MLSWALFRIVSSRDHEGGELFDHIIGAGHFKEADPPPCFCAPCRSPVKWEPLTPQTTTSYSRDEYLGGPVGHWDPLSLLLFSARRIAVIFLPSVRSDPITGKILRILFAGDMWLTQVSDSDQGHFSESA